MRAARSSMAACSRCSRASLTGCGVPSASAAAGVRSRAEDEAEARVEADLVDQLHRAREVLVGLAGKPTMKLPMRMPGAPAQPAHDALYFGTV